MASRSSTTHETPLNQHLMALMETLARDRGLLAGDEDSRGGRPFVSADTRRNDGRLPLRRLAPLRKRWGSARAMAARQGQRGHDGDQYAHRRADARSLLRGLRGDRACGASGWTTRRGWLSQFMRSRPDAIGRTFPNPLKRATKPGESSGRRWYPARSASNALFRSSGYTNQRSRGRWLRPSLRPATTDCVMI